MSVLSACRELPLLEIVLSCHQKVFDQARFVVGMPQVIQAEICPKLFGLLRDSLNLDLTAPDDGQLSMYAKLCFINALHMFVLI